MTSDVSAKLLAAIHKFPKIDDDNILFTEIIASYAGVDRINEPTLILANRFDECTVENMLVLIKNASIQLQEAWNKYVEVASKPCKT